MCKRKIVIISIIALLLYGVGQIEKHCETKNKYYVISNYIA